MKLVFTDPRFRLKHSATPHSLHCGHAVRKPGVVDLPTADGSSTVDMSVTSLAGFGCAQERQPFDVRRGNARAACTPVLHLHLNQQTEFCLLFSFARVCTVGSDGGNLM